jgi:flagellar biosynthesis protein FlhB
VAGGEKDGKTEKPTPKKLKEARKEGQIARSPELISWISLLLGVTALQSMVNRSAKFMTGEMTQASNLMAHPDQNQALAFMGSSIGKGLMTVLPLTLTFMAIAVVGHLAELRFVPPLKGIKFSFSKVDPIKGAKRLFSPQSTFQAAKQLLKLVVFGTIAYMTFFTTAHNLIINGPYATSYLLTTAGKTVIKFVREAALAGIVIGIIDYVYQRRKINNSLKMSKHEIKQESRQQDLPPEVRGKIRQKQRQLTRNRMMAAIAKADVVIVNPIHIAIALQYDPERGAPRVLAKGAGFIAERIRERAEEHKIPLVQDIPLARALHKSCDVDDEIPAALFSAVAQVLAFVFALKNRGTSDGFHKMPGTPELDDIERLAKREQELVDA